MAFDPRTSFLRTHDARFIRAAAELLALSGVTLEKFHPEIIATVDLTALLTEEGGGGGAGAAGPTTWPGAAKYGVLSREVLANPAAGAQFVFTVPAGEVWLFRSVFAKLQASAAAASRYPHLSGIYPGASTRSWLISQVITQMANEQYFLTWARGIAGYQDTGNDRAQAPLVDVPMLGVSTVQSEVINMQGGDQWTEISAVVEKFVAG